MTATPWSTASAGLSLPLRLAWVLAREDGRPPVEVGGPGPLLLGAAVLQLLHDRALRREGAGYVRGDGDPGDPFEAWVRDALPAGDDGDVQLEELAADVAGRAGEQATEALEDLGLLTRVPRKVLGVPLGRSLRVADPEALIRDRGLVRSVLDGQESHDVAMGALIAYLHHGGLVAHLDPEDLHAAELRAARIAGEDPDGRPAPQGPVAEAVARTVAAMHVVLVPVGVVQIVSTNAHHHPHD
ncbi:GPP34 family phosphoprotein [Patulibacter minatonensis]|uniref:GPP34 family phosphoprotein n=1 Tax=Patulibacter minatonensis TaxID=298163 RepID=UPI00047EF550|nr:GPP34 family phosphoprotein [Patulibacter minatonensis]